MSGYIAMRTMTRYDEEGIDSAKSYYNQIFSIALYKQFKDETDAILVAEGYGDVTVSA